jgi:hypothetical protein
VALRSLSVVFCLLNICYFLSLMLTTSSLAQKNLPLKGAGVGESNASNNSFVHSIVLYSAGAHVTIP